MTTSFKPEEYKDEYTLALKKMVEDKLKGVEIKAPEIEKIEFEDLMTALKQSVLSASGKR
jgi:non-homologous end joining protein Ku